MVGYRYLHSAIDDRTRIVYSEILDNEQASTAAGVLGPRRRLVPIDRDSRRAGRHRQRALLPLGTVAPGMRRDRDHREQDPALPAPNKRQDRAIPPDPLRGMGLHSALDLRNPTGPRLHRVRAFLQSPPIPRSTRLGNPNQHPQGQPPRDAQLGVYATTVAGSGHSAARHTWGGRHRDPCDSDRRPSDVVAVEGDVAFGAAPHHRRPSASVGSGPVLGRMDRADDPVREPRRRPRPGADYPRPSCDSWWRVVKWTIQVAYRPISPWRPA